MPSLARARSIRKSSTVARKSRGPATRPRKSLTKSRSVSRSKSSGLRSKSGGMKSRGDIVNFYCVKCKKHSKAPVDRYDKSKKGGATMARASCQKCDTNMTMFVKRQD